MKSENQALNYKNKELPISQRVEDLLSRMTLVEKIGQMFQFHSNDPSDEEIIKLAREGNVGSRLFAADQFGGWGESFQLIQVEKINEVQKVAVEESRLGIPIINGRDIIHGHRTVMPVPLAQAASWEPEMVRQGNEIAAAEASACGVHWAFAPMIDIARDPRWGRIIEGAGEDPYLGSKMAVAAVQGFQGSSQGDGSSGSSMADEDRIAACAKHFIAYGGAEGGRDYNTVECSENTLRNTYLPPFKAAVEAGVATVMSGFHEVGGEPVSGSHKFLTRLLKDELGFDGFVVSDWGSVTQLEAFGVSANQKESFEIAINAGVDMDMVDYGFLEKMLELVNEGKISLERLDDAVRRILTVKFQVGLFERPYTDTSRFEKVLANPKHIDFARKFAAQTMVLLENKNKTLPLSLLNPKTNKPLKIALVGPMAEVRMQMMGAWTLDGKVEEVVSIAEGLKAAAPEAEITVVSGLTDEMLIEVRGADVIIVALGESHMSSGEARNVTRLSLPVGQEELVESLRRFGKPIVSLICAGRPYSIGQIAQCSDAVLYAWHPGIQAGNAVADILFGKVNPSAKLPMTIPRNAGQVPIYYNHKKMGQNIDEYYNVGNRAHYIDELGSPLYSFGFGLSYTNFEYIGLEVVMISNQEAKASVDVKNIGDVAGQEVVQCYVRDKVATQTRPAKELKGFEKIFLEAGESRRVEFLLGKNELSFYDINNNFTLEPGEFLCGIGGNCLVELDAQFEIKE